MAIRPIPTRALTQAVAIGLLLLAAACGLWLASRPAPPSIEARVTEVASGLRCPSCAGQSVATSESDLARQMRQVITEQLADGRSPNQIKAWFAERYGDAVLLDPPVTGLGLAVRFLPFVVLAVGALVVARRVRERRAVLIVGGLAGGLGIILLISGGLTPPTENAAAWSPAGTVAASSTPAIAEGSTGSRSALVALQAGHADIAQRRASAALASTQPNSRAWQDALLVLGLAQHQNHDPRATATLERFLRVAPDHPAASLVRNLMERR